MPSLKAIRRRIVSVKSTQQITKAVRPRSPRGRVTRSVFAAGCILA